MYIQKRSFTYNTLVGFLIIALLITPIFDIVSALAARSQDKCQTELAEAESKYQLGQLDEAIKLVNRCFEKDELSIKESEKAYKLLGKAYHAKGFLEQAKENLRELLQLLPNWRPNPDLDTPSFQRLAEEVIREMEQEKPTEPAIEEPQRKEAVEPVQQPEEAVGPQEEPVTEPVEQPQKRRSKTALWIGIGGVIVGGVVAGVALSGNGKTKGSIKVTW